MNKGKILCCHTISRICDWQLISMVIFLEFKGTYTLKPWWRMSKGVSTFLFALLVATRWWCGAKTYGTAPSVAYATEEGEEIDVSRIWDWHLSRQHKKPFSPRVLNLEFCQNTLVWRYTTTGRRSKFLFRTISTKVRPWYGKRGEIIYLWMSTVLEECRMNMQCERGYFLLISYGCGV